MGGLDGEGGVSENPNPNDDLTELGAGAAGDLLIPDGNFDCFFYWC